jgi:hypothetical protein
MSNVDTPQPWNAQYLRLISFPVQPQAATVQNWMAQLTGSERESRIEKKREVEEEGRFEGATISLSIDLLRLQWTASPRMSADAIPDKGFPILGSFLDRKEWFRGLMHRWFEMSPPIHRLAFAGVLLLPVPDRESGYRMLDENFLHSVTLDPASTDFMYRINRRVNSRIGVDNLAINRLTTWTVGLFQTMLRARIGPPGGADEKTIEAEQYACVLEFDINTVPEPSGRVLPQESLPRIFDELVEHSAQIAQRGDMP